MFKQTIVAAISPGRSAEQQVQSALSLAAAFRSDIHLLSVLNGGSHAEVPCWPSNAYTSLDPDISVVRSLARGEVALTIAGYADQTPSSMLIMNSREHGPWSGLWRPSVCDRVLRWTRRPVCI